MLIAPTNKAAVSKSEERRCFIMLFFFLYLEKPKKMGLVTFHFRTTACKASHSALKLTNRSPQLPAKYPKIIIKSGFSKKYYVFREFCQRKYEDLSTDNTAIFIISVFYSFLN